MITDTTLPHCIELVGGPADGAAVEAPEGWPNVPHVTVLWRGATLYYAPEPDSQHLAIFDRQEGSITVPAAD